MNRVLDGIARDNNLMIDEIRALGDDGRLLPEPRYGSRQVPSEIRRPLDAVGVDILPVRDPTDPAQEIQLRVDRVRAGIQAYPGRAFLSAGVRYIVDDWDDSQLESAKFLGCRRDARVLRTWRRRTLSWRSSRLATRPTAAADGRLRMCVAEGEYLERVRGSVEVQFDPNTGQPGSAQRITKPAVRVRFDTRAILLGFPEPFDVRGFESLAQALRHVLPVHVGVAADDFEVVAGEQLGVAGDAWKGLAIVDLFPGGIGLVDALREEYGLVVKLLSCCSAWLSACCDDEMGCGKCLVSPAADAVDTQQQLSRQTALQVLSTIFEA